MLEVVARPSSLPGYDVSLIRTLPRSGTFTADQAMIFDCVHSVHQRISALLLVGRKWREIERDARRLYLQGLQLLGVVAEGEWAEEMGGRLEQLFRDGPLVQVLGAPVPNFRLLPSNVVVEVTVGVRFDVDKLLAALSDDKLKRLLVRPRLLALLSTTSIATTTTDDDDGDDDSSIAATTTDGFGPWAITLRHPVLSTSTGWQYLGTAMASRYEVEHSLR